jgi:hypothetical protein
MADRDDPTAGDDQVKDRPRSSRWEHGKLSTPLTLPILAADDPEPERKAAA